MDYVERIRKAETYLDTLCSVKPNRRTGSPGNRAATDFVASIIERWGYILDTRPFACLDFKTRGACLRSGSTSFDVQVSPFSLGCDVRAELVVASTVEELEEVVCMGKILLMRGHLCAEQLMPKNFVFYNPDHHKRIYALLETKQPAAIVTATGRSPDLVGAMYPFPLIEDGDFDIPSVFCTDEVGEQIAARAGQIVQMRTEAERVPSSACNVIAVKNPEAETKVVVTAHIDAYGTTQGALDDASGVVVQLLLAEALRDYRGSACIEIAAFNGEDYYSAGGQMDYLNRYGNDLGKIMVAINVDDVGYVRGKTAYSLYGCPEHIRLQARTVFDEFKCIMEGEPWYQGDHMVFVQNGVPAVAVTSERFSELMSTITHTEKDTPDMVDCGKLVELASALERFIVQL